MAKIDFKKILTKKIKIQDKEYQIIPFFFCLISKYMTVLPNMELKPLAVVQKDNIILFWYLYNEPYLGIKEDMLRVIVTKDSITVTSEIFGVTKSINLYEFLEEYKEWEKATEETINNLLEQDE